MEQDPEDIGRIERKGIPNFKKIKKETVTIIIQAKQKVS